MDQDKNRQILHDRALALAREYAPEEENGERLDVTVFRLGNERYAFESLLTREVVPCDGYTPLPCVPTFIAGIMNLRGRILSLVDLRLLFEVRGDVESEQRKVIVLSNGEMEFGVIVDEIEGNTRLPLSSLQEDYPTLNWAGGGYLRGVTRERLILLDAGKLLRNPALVVDEEIS